MTIAGGRRTYPARGGGGADLAGGPALLQGDQVVLPELKHGHDDPPQQVAAVNGIGYNTPMEFKRERRDMDRRSCSYLLLQDAMEGDLGWSCPSPTTASRMSTVPVAAAWSVMVAMATAAAASVDRHGSAGSGDLGADANSLVDRRGEIQPGKN